MTRILEQCNGTIKDGLCMKCFNRTATSSSICIQMYEVEDKKAPVLDVDRIFEDYCEYFTGNGDYCFSYIDKDSLNAILIQQKEIVRNEAVKECIDKIAESEQLAGLNMKQGIILISELSKLKK